MRRSPRFGLVLAVGCLTVGAAEVRAQAMEEEQQPETRVVTVTSFDLPFTVRSKVFPFMREYVLPASQLHPKILNFRVLLHNWGSNADQVSLVAEYASIEDIEAECGQPCDDYFEAHPEPEEGDPGFEEFEERQQTFLKYFSNHRDEIYTTNMDIARVEGESVGRVGPPPPETESEEN